VQGHRKSDVRRLASSTGLARRRTAGLP